MSHKRKNIFLALSWIVLCALILIFILYFTSNSSQEFTVTDRVEMDIQDYGTITLALDSNTAPVTVANFVQLTESGFYDGLTIHRVMDGYMIQGGDPNGDGTGGSGTSIIGEFRSNGFENGLSHLRGAISMTRFEDYNSASSQFFIVHQDSTYLDGEYAVFGYVESGMEIIDAMCSQVIPIDYNGMLAPSAQPVILQMRICD